MKTRIIKQESKEFQPITMEFTFETVEEARLIYHVMNRRNILNILRSDVQGGIALSGYSQHIAEELNADPDSIVELSAAIEAQGFEV